MWNNDILECRLCSVERKKYVFCNLSLFLGVIEKLWKTTISFVTSVRPHWGVRLPMEKSLMKFDIWGVFFLKTVEKIKVSLELDSNNGYFTWRGTAVAQWLRCCATNQKVAGSITGGVIGIFHWRKLSDRTMALGSTQPLTEMSTRSISWGVKSGRCVRLTTLPPSWAIVM